MYTESGWWMGGGDYIVSPREHANQRTPGRPPDSRAHLVWHGMGARRAAGFGMPAAAAAAAESDAGDVAGAGGVNSLADKAD